MTQIPQHPYEEEGYQVLCDAGDQMHADLILDALHAAEIRAIQYPSASEGSWNIPPTQTTIGIRILVPEDQLEEALEVYGELEGIEFEEDPQEEEEP